MARADIGAADGQVQQATGAYEQAVEELQTKQELRSRNADVVAVREIERLTKVVETRQGAVTAAGASKQAAETKLNIFLPAEKASAEAVLAQAQVDLEKTIVYAGTSGRVEQFSLRVGDFVSPIMRPAGVLIPSARHSGRLVAGFGQIEAQVIKPGMIGEVTCVAKPLTIIPMVVTSVQEALATGQVRATEQLIDPTQFARPGTLAVFLEPLYEGGLDDVPPGSSCIANAYSNHHAELANKELSSIYRFALHAVDAVGLVHAMILRLQALVLPVKVLVGAPH
jgi:multidrug resistance efflux pump